MKRGFGEVAGVGQGTWQIESDRKRALAALDRGIDLGLVHIDTAEMYGNGKAEAIVGDAIRGRRDRIFLVSKVLPSNASRKGTARACEASLGRLGTDHLDAYLLHWPGSHPIAETIEAFERLEADGKIRSWGVSNFSVKELEEAERIAGEGRIACNQVLHHLEERQIEHGVIPWCRAHGVTVVGYSPFGQGALPKSRVLDAIAEETETTPYAVALAFLIGRGTLTIPKASRIEHVEANAEALGLTLGEAQIARIDAAFPRGRNSGQLPML